MNKKTLYFISLTLFVLNYFLFFNTTADYRSFAWFVWMGNFASSLLINVFLILYTTIRQEEDSLTTLLKLILSFVPIFLFHFLIGMFLSFLARNNEFSFMLPNNSLKTDIPWVDFSNFFLKYLPIYFPYLLTKGLVYYLPKSSLHGGFLYIRDIFVLLLGCAIAPLVALKLSENNLADINTFSFISISALIFIPWSSFFSKDVGALKTDRLPLFQATTRFPIEIVENGPQGWGFLFLIFGIIPISVAIIALRIPGDTSVWKVLVQIVFFIPFFLFGIVFILIGLNMQWAQKKTTITSDKVSTRVRILVPWVHFINWEKSLNDYRKPYKDTIQNTNSKNRSTIKTYEIKLPLKIQVPRAQRPKFELDRNVTLYKAYHTDDLDEHLAIYRNVFHSLDD